MASSFILNEHSLHNARAARNGSGLELHALLGMNYREQE